MNEKEVCVSNTVCVVEKESMLMCMHAWVFLCLWVCLLRTFGCGVDGGSPLKHKMNRSGRVMWLSRPFRFNYELITRQDHRTGKRAGSRGGETKKNNNWEKTEGWKLLVKPFSWWMPENVTQERHLLCKPSAWMWGEKYHTYTLYLQWHAKQFLDHWLV